MIPKEYEKFKWDSIKYYQLKYLMDNSRFSLEAILIEIEQREARLRAENARTCWVLQNIPCEGKARNSLPFKWKLCVYSLA